MAEIIDLAARRAERDAPDPDCVRMDQDGRPLFRFALEYELDGAMMADVSLWAYSWADAERRIAAVRASLVCLGQVKATGRL